MPETAQRPKFLLLETIMDLLDKKTDQDNLKSVLQDSRQSLEAIKSNFESDLSGLEPHVTEAVADEIQLIQKLFTDWDNAFGAIDKYFETGVEFDLVSAGEMVKRCSEGLNYALECYTNNALLAMGPTDIPRLNLLVKCVEEVKNGDSRNKLERVIADEYITVEGAKKELQFEKNVLTYPEQDEMIRAYEKLQEGLTKIGFFTKDGDEKLLDQGLKIAMQAYPQVKELVPKVNYKRMIQAPTESALSNLLINMIVARRKGSINDQIFMDTVREVEAEFNKTKQLFQHISHQDSGYEEEFREAGEGLEMFQGAIGDCYAFINTREGLFLEQAEKELRKSADMLVRASKFFEDLAEREGKTPCVRCGQYNQPQRKTCEKCGAILPKAAEGPQTSSTFAVQEGGKFARVSDERSDEAVPENLQKIFNAVKQVKDGEITTEEFEDSIYQLQDVMEKHRDAGFSPIPHVSLDNLPQAEKEITRKVLEDTKEIKTLFEEGYRDWEEGLDCFLEYVETNEEDLLNQGVQIMLEGNRKLNRLQRIAADMNRMIQEHKDENQDTTETEGEGQE